MGVAEAIIGSAILGGGLSLYSGRKQAKATEKAMNAQAQQAQALATQQQEQYNKINQKKPNINAIKTQNVLSDMPQTQLTDIAGIPLLNLLLSRNASLGGGQANNQSNNNVMSFLMQNKG